MNSHTNDFVSRTRECAKLGNNWDKKCQIWPFLSQRVLLISELIIDLLTLRQNIANTAYKGLLSVRPRTAVRPRFAGNPFQQGITRLGGC